MRVREMFPSGYLAAEDLLGKDVPLTIAGVQREKLRANPTDDEKEKWVLRFVEMERRPELVDRKALCLNKTNAKTIAKLHGTNADEWTGKRIALYPTTCMAFGERVPCIRIRDKVPAPKPDTRSKRSTTPGMGEPAPATSEPDPLDAPAVFGPGPEDEAAFDRAEREAMRRG